MTLTRIQQLAAAIGLQADEFKGCYRLYTPGVAFSSVIVSPRMQAVADDLRSRIIRRLTRAGHSTAKAMEIALDAERGDSLALQWIKGVSPQ